MNSMFSLVVLDYSQKEKTWLYESKKFLYVKYDCNVSLAKKSFNVQSAKKLYPPIKQVQLNGSKKSYLL